MGWAWKLIMASRRASRHVPVGKSVNKNDYAAAITARSTARLSASVWDARGVASPQTCRRPGPTSYRHAMKAPLSNTVAQGTHLPPGPSTAVPLSALTAPDGGKEICIS